ncbi:MAG TPA: hypothetical protein VLU96_04195 [Gaiellaceae bacterium]|nr:hypothetical protein [Gaiellaceae bacterium]
MSSRTRTILKWVLIVVGSLILLISSLTVWVKRQALDTDAWTKTSVRLLQNDDIRGALSVYIVDQLYKNGQVQDRLQQQLPPNLKGLAGPVAGALREPAQTAVDRFLDRPRVQAAWKQVNRAAHKQLVAILENKTRSGVSTANGEVVLDLHDFIVNVANQLGIGSAVSSRLPENAGQITIMKSSQLKAAQDIVKVIKALSWLLIFLALACFAGAIWLAPSGSRRQALQASACAFLLVGILLLVIRKVAESYIVNALTSGESLRKAADATWLIGTSLLSQVAWSLILYGLVALIGCVLAGPYGWATRFRAWLAPMWREHPGLAWAILGAVFLLLLLWGPTPAFHTWLGVLILAGVLAIGFEAFRRVVVGEAGSAQAAT